MRQKFKGFTHSHFVLCGDALRVVNNNGSYTLPEGYFDYAGALGDKGKYIKYVDARNIKGQDIGKRFRFDLSLRRLMARESDKDFYGVKLFDYLKNHPFCEGSPNGDYYEDAGKQVQAGVVFREMNTERDAAVALEADEYRIKAQGDVLALDEQTLEEVAAILGHYGAPDKVMRLKVLEFAGKRPDEYFELMNSGDRSVRAIVRKAIDSQIFNKRGSVIIWDGTPVGGDEDDAISTLMKDPDMLKALQEKLGLKTPIEVKKARGNPNFGKKKVEI